MIYILTDITPWSGPRSIGAYRLATELRIAGYDVEVLDFLSSWTIDEILNYIDSGPKPLWIGFSTTFMGPGKDKKIINNRPGWDNLTRLENEDYFWSEIKKRAPIVLGGSKVGRLKYIYNADWIISGYADKAIIPLTEFIIGKSKDLKFTVEKIKNIYTEEEYTVNSINCEESYPVNDISNIPTFFHHSDFIEDNEVLPIEISRGCIFKCAFCAFPLNGKTKNDYIRPKDSIINEIKIFQKNYKTNRFMFMDDTFNDTVEKMQMVKEIYDNVQPFEFWSYGRLDLLAAKPEMMELVNKIGWKYFTFGIETFNRTAGKKIGKGADPEKLKTVLKDLRQIHPSSYFIFEMIIGLPGEDKKSIDDTLDWLVKNPNLWDEIHFKELSINNKDYNLWNSQMALTPEKFGISVLKFHPRTYTLNWHHDSMNKQQAEELSRQAQEKMNHIRPRDHNHYFMHYADLTKEDIARANGNKNKAFVEKLWRRRRRYIHKKLTTR